MATEYVISFRDNRPLGSREAIETLILTHFPSVKFHWTTSGLEKLRIAKVALPSDRRTSAIQKASFFDMRATPFSGEPMGTRSWAERWVCAVECRAI